MGFSRERCERQRGKNCFRSKEIKQIRQLDETCDPGLWDPGLQYVLALFLGVIKTIGEIRIRSVDTTIALYPYQCSAFDNYTVVIKDNILVLFWKFTLKYFKVTRHSYLQTYFLIILIKEKNYM